MNGRVKSIIVCLLLAFSGEWVQASALRIAVSADGPCRLSLQTLAAGLNLSPETAWQALEAGELTLELGGAAVAWRRAGNDLLFFGSRNDSVESAFTSYRLSVAPGMVMVARDCAGDPVDPGTPLGQFTDTIHFETNNWCSIQRESRAGITRMAWQFLSTSGEYSYKCAVPDPAPGQGPARLTVGLRSLHSEDFSDQHRFRVTWDGTMLGEASWAGQSAFIWSGSIPGGPLVSKAGGTLTLRELTGVFSGRGALDWIEVTYSRLALARNDRLVVRSPQDGPFVCSGFSNPAVAVWDVTNPREPVVLEGLNPALRAEGYGVGFQTVSGRQYAVFTTNSISVPLSVRADSTADLAASTNEADWVAITPFKEWADFSAGAQDLADFRARQGLRTRVVTAEQIADTFGDGICSTAAIRAFIRATAGWAVRPRYVVLVGYGNLDYRRESSKSKCLLPTPEVPFVTGMWAGEICSGDATFGDDDGDMIPEMAIGRIPSMTAGELTEAINKIKLYESAAGCKTNALFTADNPTNETSGVNLHESVDGVAAHAALAGYVPVKCYVPANQLDSSGIQSAVLDKLSNGVGLFYHLGHADAWQLGYKYGFLNNTRLGVTQRWNFPPVALIQTCWINRFHHPSYPDTFCLEAWRRSGTGFSAILAPSSLIEPQDGALMGREMMKAWALDSSLRLGDVVLLALGRAKPRMVMPQTLSCMTLLGDPAMVIRFNETSWGTKQSWLRANGMTAANADTDDNDGDTFPNWLEYQKNTDPQSVADHPLRIGKVKHEGDRMSLTFVSAPGVKYHVVMSLSLASDAEWTPVSVAPSTGGAWMESIPATGTETTLFVPAGPGPQFFKIKVLP